MVSKYSLYAQVRKHTREPQHLEVHIGHIFSRSVLCSGDLPASSRSPVPLLAYQSLGSQVAFRFLLQILSSSLLSTSTKILIRSQAIISYQLNRLRNCSIPCSTFFSCSIAYQAWHGCSHRQRATQNLQFHRI